MPVPVQRHEGFVVGFKKRPVPEQRHEGFVVGFKNACSRAKT